MPTAPPTHKPAGKKPKEAWQRTEKHKGKTTTQRGYGWQWQSKIRPRIIARDKGLCQPCYRQGIITRFDDVDHITSKEKGGTDDDSNLECICRNCHKLKTQQEKQKGEGRVKSLQP